MNISSIGSHFNAPAELAAPRQVNEEQRAVSQAVRAVNAAGLFGHDNQLTFVVDQQSKRALVRIVNRETGELVEQIPAEYLLRLAEKVKGR